MATPLNIIGGWYSDASKPWSQQDICNYIPFVAEKSGTLSPVKAVPAPGLKPFVEIASNGGIRGMEDVEGKLLVVAGTTLYQISNTGVAIPRGTIPGTGLVSISYNQAGIANQVLIGNGSAGYVYDTSALTLTRITDAAFPGTKAVDYLDSYLLGVEPLGRFWFHSNLADAEDYNALDRYEAETSPDRIVTLAVSNEEVVVFGQTTTDFFVNTGATTGTFQAKGVSMTVGCASAHSVVKLDNTLFWLDNFGVFQRLNGYSPQPVSTRVLEDLVGSKNADGTPRFDWSRCVATTYQDSGRKIAYWTFREGLTIGYDVTTGMWHRREAYGLNGRDRISCIVNWNRKWIAGDYVNGRLYELDWDYMLQVDQPHVRRICTAPLSANGNRLTLHRFKLAFDAGGPETIAIPFPEQPEPPTLTGSYPDGVVGIANAAFPYVASGGTPPYTFTNRTGNDPAPGIGVMPGTGIVPAGTPTEEGSYEHRPRVTDANGLYADHIDPYSVNSMILALGSPVSPGGTYGVLQISDTTNWAVTRIPVSGYQHMMQIGGSRVLLYSPSNSTYTDDLGLTYSTPVSGLGGDSSERGGCYVQNVVLVAGSASDHNVYRSTDNGGSWTPVDQGKAQHNCVAHGDRAVFDNYSIAGFARFMYSDDACATTLIDGSVTGLSTNQSLTSFGGKIVMGGKIHATTYPGIAITEDCIAVTTAQINSTDATDFVTAACAAEIDGVEIWVFGLNNGKIYWSEDLVTFTQWVETMPDYIYTIAWSGSHFMVGGNSSSYVLTSPDGKVGTQRPCTLDDAVTNIVVVV